MIKKRRKDIDKIDLYSLSKLIYDNLLTRLAEISSDDDIFEHIKDITDKNSSQLNGAHQIEYEALAISVAKNFQGLNVTNQAIQFGLSSVYWPGRIDQIYNNPRVYFDVAHNDGSFISLCDFANKLIGSKTLILALQKNKNITKAIKYIENTYDKIVLTQNLIIKLVGHFMDTNLKEAKWYINCLKDLKCH